MDFNEIKNFSVDAVVSFGPNCRAADAMKRNKLRFFSGPFYWCMKYNLDCVYEQILRGGKASFLILNKMAKTGRTNFAI